MSVSSTGGSITQTITFASTITANSLNRTEKITGFVSASPGTYTVRLVAFNDDGDSPNSNQVSYIIPEPADGTPPAAPVLSAPYSINYPSRYSGSRRNRFKIDVTISATTPVATHVFLAVRRGLEWSFAGSFRVRPGRNTLTIDALGPSGAGRYDIGRTYNIGATAYYVLNNKNIFSSSSNLQTIRLISRTIWVIGYVPR